MPKKIKLRNSADGYNLAASTYDRKEAYLNSFEKGKVLELLGDARGKEILDIGAGTGRITLMLARRSASVTALDVSVGMLESLKRKAKNLKVATVVANAEALPFPDDFFDVVTAAFLLVHLKDTHRFFDEAYRVLKDGGLFLVTNINQKDPPTIETTGGNIIIESFYHRPEKIREELKELAFAIEREEIIKENGVWINQIILAKK